MIEKVGFGTMTIDGRTYTSDVLIYPDGQILSPWWRARGHRLALADIEELVARQPSLLVVGSGIFGRMKPESSLQSALSKKGIELYIARTKAAADYYNRIPPADVTLAACFHLTC